MGIVVKPSKRELVDMFNQYYEVDIDNCLMDNTMWIEEVVNALLDPEYLKKFLIEYEEYLEQRKD